VTKDGPNARRSGTNVESASPRRASDGNASRRDDERDAWGSLPLHARAVFRTQGGGDMPAQYRDWIDAYYKRLLAERH